MIGTVIYLGCGIAYAWLENRMFSGSWPEETSPALNALLGAQMAVHLFRIVLTWPLYLVEDFLIFLASFHDSEGDDPPRCRSYVGDGSGPCETCGVRGQSHVVGSIK